MSTPQKPQPITISPANTALTPQEIARQASGRKTWHRKASKPISLWMFALLGVLFTHRWIPESIWLLVHIITIGLITNSILIWSQHFTEALLKTKLNDSFRTHQLRRIYLLNLSFITLIAGILLPHFPLTLTGSIGIGITATWHALSLLNQYRTALPSRFGATVRYYIAASLLLPIGATFGALLTQPTTHHGQLLLAHEATNILGFVGITAIGTLITLWPTMLRTKMHPQALSISTRALALMCLGLTTVVTAALTSQPHATAAGLTLYAAAIIYTITLMIRTCTTKKPTDYPTLSVLLSLIWLTIATLWAAYLALTQDFTVLSLRPLTPLFTVGFLLQLLLGAMSYLLPVRMGGGPAAVRAANKEFNRFTIGRITIINLCLIIFALPADLTGTWVRTLTSLLGALTLAAYLPLALRGVRASITARKKIIAARARGERPSPTDHPQGIQPPAPNIRRELIIGTLAAAGATALGATISRTQNSPRTSTSHITPTGNTTTLKVAMTQDMRFEPNHLTVPAGDHLLIELTNQDPTNIHDLILSNGAASGRINSGETKTLDAGIIGQNLDGWCSIIGHKQMGMTLRIQASGSTQHTHHNPNSSNTALQGSDINVLNGSSSPNFTPRDAVLQPVPAGEKINGQTVHRHTIDVQELTHEIAPGISLNAWTFNGTYMGPTLRGNLGDIFEITFTNSGTMTHSIDFHAGMVSPDGNMGPVAPGQSITYRFQATGSGVWLYHCGTMPMTVHMAAGMFGAVIINPTQLDPVDREYVLVHNDTYLTDTGHTAPNGDKLTEISPESIEAGTPTLSVFNGHATQYREHPLTARVGETVRFWLLAAGPSKGMSFHVVGSQFHTVYKEGGYLLRNTQDAFGTSGGHSQALDLAPAQGGFVEMKFLEPGSYVFVNHDFAELERGAKGIIKVSP